MSTTTDLPSRQAKPAREGRRWELLLLISSLLAAILFGTAAYREIALAPWRKYQREYRSLLIAGAGDEQSRRAAESFQVRYYQAYLPGLGRVDRCPTCHLGVENPSMKEDVLRDVLKIADPSTKEDLVMVLKTHPGDFLAHHAVDRFGCTICHGGVGRATEKEEAHGKNPHRPAHFLTAAADSEMLEVACAQCHSDPQLPGMPVYNLSRKLFTEKGCLACHSLRGTGPALRGVSAIQGPDLTKTANQHDLQWHVDHFLDPQKTVEGSKMPNFGFTEKEARALAHLMMSFTGEIPSLAYIPPPTAGSETGAPPPPTLEQLGANIDPKAAPGYVGSQTCLSCHTALTPVVGHTWQNSKMARAFEAVSDVPDNAICLPCHTTGHNPDTNVFAEPNVGCEACHGPGKEYVADVLAGKIAEHKAQAVANVLQKDRCLNCHKTPHVPNDKHVETIRAESETGFPGAEPVSSKKTSNHGAAACLAASSIGESHPRTVKKRSNRGAMACLVMSLVGESPSLGYMPLLVLASETSEDEKAVLEFIGANMDPDDAPGYVGSKACLSCHAELNPEVAKNWQESKKAHAFEALRDVPDREICLPCHSTGYNPLTNAFTEPGVGCEACHGPGKDYCIDATQERRAEHAERADPSNQDRNFCVDCHRVHVPRAGHAEAMRAEKAVQ